MKNIDTRDSVIQALRDNVRKLSLELEESKAREQQVWRENERAIQSLRERLVALDQALKAAFKEINGITGDGAATTKATKARVAVKGL